MSSARQRAGAMYLYPGVIVAGSVSVAASPMVATAAALNTATVQWGARATAATMTATPAAMPVAAAVYTPPGAITFVAGTGTASATLRVAAATGGGAFSTAAADRLAAMNIACPWRHLAVLPGTTDVRQRAAGMYLYIGGLYIPGSAGLAADVMTAGASMGVAAAVYIPPPTFDWVVSVTARQRTLMLTAPYRELTVEARQRSLTVVAQPVDEELETRQRPLVVVGRSR